MKEERPGWEWVEVGNGGFWSKVKGNRHSHTNPIFCPHCHKLSATLDNDYFQNYGICMECYVMNVENRQNPLIDVEMMKNRLKERGY